MKKEGKTTRTLTEELTASMNLQGNHINLLPEIFTSLYSGWVGWKDARFWSEQTYYHRGGTA